ncbi:tetratricopeptide repeat protein [Mucilaginibacter sp.]|uniref:tetratricopeptide repeat protein n=1 Tax=Mucilaginibacter sp. TaxID=1882438 RepID=UPI003D0ABF74
MLKKTLLLSIIIFTGMLANAQTADPVYDQYLDFNLARFQNEGPDKILELGEKLLPVADKLPEKARANFYFSIGKTYEDTGKPDKAIIYYEKVAAAIPNYYVVHRALGYLYLDKARQIETKLNAAATNAALNKQLTVAYTDEVKKALPHLEKAQACDPSDETLAIIKILHKNIKDTDGLNSLDDRLKMLGKNCIDILGDN